jgi:hypothetical protein
VPNSLRAASKARSSTSTVVRVMRIIVEHQNPHQGGDSRRMTQHLTEGVERGSSARHDWMLRRPPRPSRRFGGSSRSSRRCRGGSRARPAAARLPPPGNRSGDARPDGCPPRCSARRAPSGRSPHRPSLWLEHVICPRRATRSSPAPGARSDPACGE